jgi:hypothetical protein
MGLSLSSLFKRFIGGKDMRILMVGLDAAGKNQSIFFLVFCFLREKKKDGFYLLFEK